MLQDLENTATSAAILPNVAKIGNSDTPTPIGVDIGNGALKLVSNQGETRIDSYVSYLSERASMAANSGYVEYQDGDRSDLVGKQWIGGINAYFHSIKDYYRVTDNPQGKAELGLQILLAGLSQLPYRSEWNLHLVCSVHDGKTLGKPIKTALEGAHQVLMKGKKSTVQITVAAVLEEGTGAIIHYQKNCDPTNALVFDFGNGTAIVSGFNGLKLTGDRYYSQAGVETLIDAVANNELVRLKLMKLGDRHLIRAGIENRTFVYGTQYPDWNFQDSYKAELPGWVARVLKPMLRSTEDRFASATALIAIGGGACLPGIDLLLAKRNIRVLPDPLWANARGLYAYAVRKAANL